MVCDENIKAIIGEREICGVGVADRTVDVAIESGGEVYSGDGGGSGYKFIEVFFGREVEDLLTCDGHVRTEDGPQEPLAVSAETAGAVDVVAKACDDVIVVDGGCYVGAGVFRNKFSIGCPAEVALKKGWLFSGVRRVGDPEILDAHPAEPFPVCRLKRVVETKLF